MYREYHEKEAAKFNQDDCAYIHAEMWEGMTENYLSGDAVAMLYTIMTIINQIAFETDNEFEDAMEMIQVMHDDMIEEITG